MRVCTYIYSYMDSVYMHPGGSVHIDIYVCTYGSYVCVYVYIYMHIRYIHIHIRCVHMHTSKVYLYAYKIYLYTCEVRQHTYKAYLHTCIHQEKSIWALCPNCTNAWGICIRKPCWEGACLKKYWWLYVWYRQIHTSLLVHKFILKRCWQDTLCVCENMYEQMYSLYRI